ncbi:MAG TPA: serine/threonine-protein kinase [Thermoanaerobaculales bacterium]|nr:serine/threonine-protein kinase [Thermoanaerobaculales bacterium]
MANQGEKLGRWTIQQRIGRGGQGSVYAASAGEGQPLAAIKVINATRPKKRARFLREISAHDVLSSQGAPNIMPLLDHNLNELEQGGVQGFIVMPRAHSSLEDVTGILVGRTELCLEVFEGIVNGVLQAHNAGVVHRDIKPGNVLFTDETLRNPLLSDFGISLLRETTETDRLTEAGETVGAKYFMAPEQERGGVSDVGPSADIYALGKLLHFMLTGRYLYREELESAFSPDELQRDPRIRVILDRILRRTVVENPDQRIGDCSDLLAVVREVREGASRPPPSTDPGDHGDHRGAETTQSPTTAENGRESLFRSYVKVLLGPGKAEVDCSLEFDDQRNSVSESWKAIHSSVERHPEEAIAAAQSLIESQQRGVSLSLAIARCDASHCFRPHKRFLEWITRLSEERTGYPAVFTVPHVYAGFLYMLSATASLVWESWGFFEELLTARYEWYYQSGRPNFSHGFQHPYFFHPEALERKASESHNFYRKAMRDPEILRIFGLDEEQVTNHYVQAQLMMCLRDQQLSEQGDRGRAWPDFGRFYEYRVQPLLYRIDQDRRFAEGILAAFGETKAEFVERFDSRISAMAPMLDGGYIWESITRWSED